MRVDVFIDKNIVEEDWDVSDGKSLHAEFNIDEVSSIVISKKPYRILIELIGKRSPNVVSITLSKEDIIQLMHHLLFTVLHGETE